MKLLNHIKQNPSEIILMAAIIPVIAQAGIIVGVTFYGFGLALLTSVGIV